MAIQTGGFNFSPQFAHDQIQVQQHPLSFVSGESLVPTSGIEKYTAGLHDLGAGIMVGVEGIAKGLTRKTELDQQKKEHDETLAQQKQQHAESMRMEEMRLNHEKVLTPLQQAELARIQQDMAQKAVEFQEQHPTIPPEDLQSPRQDSSQPVQPALQNSLSPQQEVVQGDVPIPLGNVSAPTAKPSIKVGVPNGKSPDGMPAVEAPLPATPGGPTLGLANAASPTQAEWKPNANDLRADGSQKGNGFLGVLKRPDGGVSSELSVGVEIGGKEVEVPSMVPTLSRKEVNYLLTTPVEKLDSADSKMFDGIVQKAAAHAKERIAAGKPVFATAAESPVSPVDLTQQNLVIPATPAKAGLAQAPVPTVGRHMQGLREITISSGPNAGQTVVVDKSNKLIPEKEVQKRQDADYKDLEQQKRDEDRTLARTESKERMKNSAAIAKSTEDIRKQRLAQFENSKFYQTPVIKNFEAVSGARPMIGRFFAEYDKLRADPKGRAQGIYDIGLLDAYARALGGGRVTVDQAHLILQANSLADKFQIAFGKPLNGRALADDNRDAMASSITEAYNMGARQGNGVVSQLRKQHLAQGITDETFLPQPYVLLHTQASLKEGLEKLQAEGNQVEAAVRQKGGGDKEVHQALQPLLEKRKKINQEMKSKKFLTNEDEMLDTFQGAVGGADSNTPGNLSYLNESH
jgi:hypothetical protein